MTVTTVLSVLAQQGWIVFRKGDKEEFNTGLKSQIFGKIKEFSCTFPFFSQENCFSCGFMTKNIEPSMFTEYFVLIILSQLEISRMKKI